MRCLSWVCRSTLSSPASSIFLSTLIAWSSLASAPYNVTSSNAPALRAMYYMTSIAIGDAIRSSNMVNPFMNVYALTATLTLSSTRIAAI